MDRRDFLKSTVLGGAAAGLASTAIAETGAQTPPSDRLRVGVLGTGARAHQLIDAELATGSIDVVSLCDAYRGRAERGQARAGGKAIIADDYRRILSDRQVDAVFIVTPDHWHRQMTLDALSAARTSPREADDLCRRRGAEIIAAVERAGRILQVGSQGVSAALERQAREVVRSGRLGQITLVRAATPRAARGSAHLVNRSIREGRAVSWTA